MANESSRSLKDYLTLTIGIDLRDIAFHLRSTGMFDEAGQILLLENRLRGLTEAPTTADKMDFEKYLAWDIIQGIRKATRCPVESAIYQHCTDLMARLDSLEREDTDAREQ